ncbi:unnamed protein product [Phytomonas sp. Hart1]|nr:unnamed protein product [Phytomonas sp. Hart1]|eukprot:CCW67947.1 unnamed protein product [Phytomonas sp. isolate Hart1]
MDLIVGILRYTHLSPAELIEDDTLSVGQRHHRWVAWSVAETLYCRQDPFSFVFGLSAFLPVFIMIFLAGLASAPSTQRVPTLVLLLGLVFNTGLNIVIKKVVRSPRPAHPAAAYSVSQGMPSNHAQFICFFIVYLLLKAKPGAALHVPGNPESAKRSNLWKRNRNGTKGNMPSISSRESMPLEGPSPCLRLLYLVTGTVVCVGRVYNGHHTVAQVLVGALLGLWMGNVCTMSSVQQLLAVIAERCVVPIMLVCIHWIQWIV